VAAQLSTPTSPLLFGPGVGYVLQYQ